MTSTALISVGLIVLLVLIAAAVGVLARRRPSEHGRHSAPTGASRQPTLQQPAVGRRGGWATWDPQCPRCGRRNVGSVGSSYHCDLCAYEWRWSGDMPWPDVVLCLWAAPVPSMKENN